MHCIERFDHANLKILQERFRKDSYISRTEVDHLAKTLNVQRGKVLSWFSRERYKKGTCVAYRLLKETLL